MWYDVSQPETLVQQFAIARHPEDMSALDSPVSDAYRAERHARQHDSDITRSLAAVLEKRGWADAVTIIPPWITDIIHKQDYIVYRRHVVFYPIIPYTECYVYDAPRAAPLPKNGVQGSEYNVHLGTYFPKVASTDPTMLARYAPAFAYLYHTTLTVYVTL